MASRKPIVCLPAGTGEPQSGDVILLPTYTVAQLVAMTGVVAGSIAYASNGRALAGVSILGLGGLLFQGAGQGTGCLVTWSGSAWQVAGTSSNVQA